MSSEIKDALLLAADRYERRGNGETINDSCPVCNATEGNCMICPIGNSCRGSPVMEYLTGGRLPEKAFEAAAYLRKLADDQKL